MNLLQKVESATSCPDWNTALHRLYGFAAQGMPESEGRNGQITILALRQWQTSHLVCGQGRGVRGLRNFLNIDRPEHHRSPKWRKEERRREVADIAPPPPPPPPYTRGEGRSVFNQTSVGTVSRTTLGVCRETERGVYGPSRAQKCRLEQKLENRWRPCTSACTSSYRPGV